VVGRRRRIKIDVNRTGQSRFRIGSSVLSNSSMGPIPLQGVKRDPAPDYPSLFATSDSVRDARAQLGALGRFIGRMYSTENTLIE